MVCDVCLGETFRYFHAAMSGANQDFSKGVAGTW